jgi:branched-chain amino acid transport system permease protein
VAGRELPMWLGIALTCAIILPISPLLYRVAFRPLADASVLVLLIVAVAVHFAMSGLALVFFGPEGVRTEPMTRALFDLGPVLVSGQSILIVAARSRARRCARPPSIVQQVELKTERVASATPARTLR